MNTPFKYIFALVLALLLPDLVMADDSAAFGEWNIYNATPAATQMQVFADRLYVVNTSALSSIDLSLDPDTQQGYSRQTGLSGTSVQAILASADAQRLAIAYHDGLIDLLDAEGGITCIADLASKAMSGDKTILSLRECHGRLYVSGGFGVLIIDMLQGMVTQHYATTYPIDFAFDHDGILYRHSARKGLEYLSPGLNGSDPANWQRLADAPTLRDALTFTTADGQDLCRAIDTQGRLLGLSGNVIQPLTPSAAYSRLFPMGRRLLIQGDVLTLYEPEAQALTRNGYSPYKDCADFAPAGDTACYMLHPYYGIFRADFTNYVPGQSLGFEGDPESGLQPAGIATSYLGQMHVTPQGLVGISRRSYVNGLAAANALPGIISYLDPASDEVRNIVARQLMHNLPKDVNFQALQGFDIDPLHPDRYAICSGLYGLYLMEADTIVSCYYGPNSAGQIDAFDPTFNSTRVSAVAYDDDGNLFVANSMQDTLLRCLSADGRWLKYPHPGMTQLQDARRILIARHGDNTLKWVLNDCFYRKSRIGIYDDGGTFDVQSDDRTAYFSTLVDQDNNEWEPSYMYDVCEDLDGKVWVLTDLGPFVIEDPMATFRFAQGNPGRGKVRRVKIPRNDGTNLADYLMEATQCSCMAIDNFNRKWIGTYGAGLYLMSADCITEIHHFDTDNSPLLSSSILDLCYDPQSGLLYVSCEGGVLTYQTDAIEGASDFSSIYCYPNPVRPEYSGELRIMGLMNDSQVSITSANGDLIHRTRSQGATTTWDLRLPNGERVEPGIYLIHGVASDGNKGSICRFLVL